MDCNAFLRFFQDKISGLRGNITPLDSPFNCDLPNPTIMESFHPVSLKHLLSTYSNETFNESEEDAETFF